MEEYRKICNFYIHQDHALMNDVLKSVIVTIGAQEKTFENSMELYNKDPEKQPQLTEVTTITKSSMLKLKAEFIG